MSVLDRFRLDGKKLFITGGSRGLGREMSLAIAEAGADVILVGREAESLAKTAAEIEQRGRKAWTIVADVGQPADCERACLEALEKYGPIDILINNVGGRRIDEPTIDMPLEKWQSIIDLNLTSTFLCTKLIGGAMVRRGTGGRVINVASISGIVSNRGIGGRSYETSKAAVIQFTRSVAAHCGRHGYRIRCNCVLPGIVETPMVERFWQRLEREHGLTAAEARARFQTRMPLGSFQTANDIADAVLFLASDQARQITGVALPVDGGFLLHDR